MEPDSALKRYWTLAGTGIISANLTFTYLDPLDLQSPPRDEGAFVMTQFDGVLAFPGGAVDTIANTGGITNVAAFGDWTLSTPDL